MPAPTITLTTIDHVRADSISHSYGDRRVLTAVDLVAAPGQRVGIIGENGVGKSTLLRILAGEETPDAGEVVIPRRAGLLWQEVQYLPDQTVSDLIEGSIVDLRAIERELQDAADDLPRGGEARYSRALAAAEAAEVWTVDTRRDELIAGLGVADIPLTRVLGEISGGQRSRLALAALLLARPVAFFLDEPTNHLDDAAAGFLRDRLRDWRGPVVFASHDRAFLDEVATTIVDLDPSREGVRHFGGGYTSYLGEKAAERARWEEQYRSEQQELARLEHGVDVTSRSIDTASARRDNDKMGYDFRAGKLGRQVSRRIRNAQGRLDELRETQVRKPTAILGFAGIPHGSTALSDTGALLTLVAGSVPGRLDAATLAIGSHTSLLITGRNGAGKSTLLGALAGTIPLSSGSMSSKRGLRLALLEQEVRFARPERTCREVYAGATGEKRAENVPLVSLGLIAPRDVDRPVGSLTIGQQRRLALALIIAPAAGVPARRTDEPPIAVSRHRTRRGARRLPGCRRRSEPRSMAAPAVDGGTPPDGRRARRRDLIRSVRTAQKGVQRHRRKSVTVDTPDRPGGAAEGSSCHPRPRARSPDTR